MDQIIDNVRQVRANFIESISGLSAEQLNEIPEGFNNNIIWNMAHLVAAHQGISYIRAGLETFVDKEFYLSYTGGTKPNGLVSEEKIAEIKLLLISTLDQFKVDYHNRIFDNYKGWTTRYGVNLNSIDDATNFLSFHEGMHLGYIMALKRLIFKNI
ncbi:DinB family protein [Pedobacter cryoconitis]|uniref:DinB family protein n=1 Tax=Pedobacter cryoconitis TaxID=188932 RepID=A0A327SMA1_9SPHI|nr:DinB family protein [Pedobacter cryoconitis]RAJ29545.1 DinB family protein [Pedobacter cryoconitis]